MKKEVKLANMKEIRKYQIVKNVIDKVITQKEASKILGISVRQVRNIQNRILKEGEIGIIHKSRGKPSNNKIPEDIRFKIINLAKTKYIGFGPTFLAEKLKENETINYSSPSIRKILIEGEIWKSKKVKEKHRRRRDRRPCFGELVQLDGSIHDWFSTGKKCWLINFVDDATGHSFGKYTDSESTLNLMRCAKEYILKFGCPLAFYVDKDSIYKVNRPQTIEEQLNDEESITQFTRAMNELGIEIICANSPQAKGRVERSFGTHQDRLVKENKLRGIKTIEEGNKYLPQYYENHNKKFTVEPKSSHDMHIKLPKNAALDRILSKQEERSIAKDYTVQYKGRLFQILEVQKENVLTRNKVTIEHRLDDSIHIRYKDVYLKYEEITGKQPVKQCKKVEVMTRKEITNLITITNPNSPWRKWNSKGNSIKRKF